MDNNIIRVSGQRWWCPGQNDKRGTFPVISALLGIPLINHQEEEIRASTKIRIHHLKRKGIFVKEKFNEKLFIFTSKKSQTFKNVSIKAVDINLTC